MDENQKRPRISYLDVDPEETTQKVVVANCSKHAMIYIVEDGCSRCQAEKTEAEKLKTEIQKHRPR